MAKARYNTELNQWEYVDFDGVYLWTGIGRSVFEAYQNWLKICKERAA